LCAQTSQVSREGQGGWSPKASQPAFLWRRGWTVPGRSTAGSMPTRTAPRSYPPASLNRGPVIPVRVPGEPLLLGSVPSHPYYAAGVGLKPEIG